MVAYNFQERFVAQIRSGEKCQTIRPPRKRHVRPGETMQLYTGQRTPDSRKICDVYCMAIHPIAIIIVDGRINEIQIGGSRISDLTLFAQADGFNNISDMSEFFVKNHRLISPCRFDGKAIGWMPPGLNISPTASRGGVR